MPRRSPDSRDAAALDVREYGDSGLLVDVVADDYLERWSTAQGLAAALLADPPHGFVDVVASYQNVFASFDPLVTEHATMRAAVRARLGTSRGPGHLSRRFAVPVVYGGEAGPDLPGVAEESGVSAAELVRLHSTAPWVVRFRGSPAGAPLMDGPCLPASIARCRHPRTRVAAGSVGLSGQQCVVYTVASPGGWRLIGRTPLKMFDLADENLVAYQPGDCFQLVPIEERDWDRWVGRSPEPLCTPANGVPE